MDTGASTKGNTGNPADGGTSGPAASQGGNRPDDKGTLSLQPPRGTPDILPDETERWQYIESCARQCLSVAGYREIRVPIFEHTEIFKRGVGETTDIVNKEMYTFTDKSDRSLSLRPEGTAGVVRAYLNGGLHRLPAPVKLWYMGPMFRYERTQTGRQRQFHQVGVEAFGSAGPLIDVEVIMVALACLTAVGLESFELQVNSIGCRVCRPSYRERLKAALQPLLVKLCDDCRDRFHRNALRMLDCKSQTCQSQYGQVPASLDHLCLDCQKHWALLLGLLAQQGIGHIVNPRLVRGLDYYTRTVFEIVSRDPRLGAQSTVCAGGRYDNLVEMFGGPPTAAVGWALGMERLLLLLANRVQRCLAAFIVSSSPDRALSLANQLRQAGVSCDLDFPAQGVAARSFTKQLQQANKVGAAWAVILGEEELASGTATLKNMASGEQVRIALAELPAHLARHSC